jgi:hypothetical protein
MSKKLKTQILAAFAGTDKDMQLKAIADAYDNGDSAIVKALFELLKTNADDEEILDASFEFLYQVKDQLCAPVYAEYMLLTKGELRKEIIAACWQSGIDFKNYIPHFTTVAIVTDFETAFEAITVIENQEPPFDNALLTGSIAAIEKELSKQTEDKQALLQSLIVTLKNFKLSAFTAEFSEN